MLHIRRVYAYEHLLDQALVHRGFFGPPHMTLLVSYMVVRVFQEVLIVRIDALFLLIISHIYNRQYSMLLRPSPTKYLSGQYQRRGIEY